MKDLGNNLAGNTESATEKTLDLNNHLQNATENREIALKDGTSTQLIDISDTLLSPNTKSSQLNALSPESAPTHFSLFGFVDGRVIGYSVPIEIGSRFARAVLQQSPETSLQRGAEIVSADFVYSAINSGSFPKSDAKFGDVASTVKSGDVPFLCMLAYINGVDNENQIMEAAQKRMQQMAAQQAITETFSNSSSQGGYRIVFNNKRLPAHTNSPSIQTDKNSMVTSKKVTVADVFVQQEDRREIPASVITEIRDRIRNGEEAFMLTTLGEPNKLLWAHFAKLSSIHIPNSNDIATQSTFNLQSIGKLDNPMSSTQLERSLLTAQYPMVDRAFTSDNFYVLCDDNLKQKYWIYFNSEKPQAVAALSYLSPRIEKLL